MSAAAALNVVKQIQAVAEGPPTPEMRGCLGQVVSSLLLFLDHPDSRVRLGAARTLAKLAEGYEEDVQALDLGRARSALARCKDAIANGSSDADTEELYRLLKEMLAGDKVKKETPSPSKAPSLPPSPNKGDKSGRGEVVLKVGAQADDAKVKAAILEKAVALAGVVSVTFEGAFVIVSTRSPETAADAMFLAELLMLFKEQGLEGVSLVSAATAAADADAGEDAKASPSKLAGSSSAPQGASSSSGVNEVHLDEDEDDGEEPAYLDDDDEEGGSMPSPGVGGGLGSGGLGGPGGAAHWSFFAQNNWMTGRRLQEFGDDPTIAARLAKAKKREEERKQEEKSRIGRLSSWLTGK